MKLKVKVVKEVLCDEEKQNELTVELVVSAEFDKKILEVQKKYCTLVKELHCIQREINNITEKIAEKHGGEWRATLVTGHIIISKGVFRKKNVQVWDDELSPKLAELIKKESILYRKIESVASSLKKLVKSAIEDNTM